MLKKYFQYGLDEPKVVQALLLGSFLACVFYGIAYHVFALYVKFVF